jgi:hypothetical protein
MRGEALHFSSPFGKEGLRGISNPSLSPFIKGEVDKK